jgi:hypothetical protein
MISTKYVYRAAVILLWALALWHSWSCRGLFVDGSAFVIQIVTREWFFDFYPPRLFAMILGQIPIMTGVRLGVTDLHWLAILLSLGLFGLPTLLYQMALHRAKQDPVLLAVVLAAIGVVFMTTSFFIVGEYNSAYAIAMLTAVHLATVREMKVRDALGLLAIGVLAIRTYEAMIYLGPLLAAMVLWTLWRHRFRPVLAAAIYLAVAVCFLLGMMVAIDSVVHPWSQSHLDETYVTAKNFWQNMQFDLAFGGVLVVVLWGLARPGKLAQSSPYLWALIPIGLLALSPLLALTDTLVRPLAKSQYVARSAGGLVIVAMVIFIWIYGSEAAGRIKSLAVLRTPEAARRFLGFACLIGLGVLPSDLFLTQTWVRYLDALRQTVRTHQGVVAFEDTPLSHFPHLLLVENWVLPSQSLAVRTAPNDGVIAPPKGFDDWIPFPANKTPDMGRYFWRD